MSSDASEMGSYSHKLTLQCGHDSADLSHLPALFGLKPGRQWRAGDPRMAPDGRALGHYRTSYCTFPFDPPPGLSLPEHVAAVVERLKLHQDAMRVLSDNGTSFSFFIGWFSDFNSRDVFEWALLEDLAALRISLDLDIYGPDKLAP